MDNQRVEQVRAAHEVLAEFRYEPRPVEHGYANQTLYVNVGDRRIESRPVSEDMKRTFTGGRGFDLWLLWNAVNEQTRWDSPENEVVIAGGPLCGTTTYPGAGKSIAVAISPLTGIPVDSNVGGYFGPLLKFAGFDAIEVQGVADQEVIVYIDGNQGLVQIIAAPEEDVNTYPLAELLTEMYGSTPEEKCGVSIVSAGEGADQSLMGCLNFSFYDLRRKIVRLKQAGRGGIGTVLRHKRVKALVVKHVGVNATSNDPANWGQIAEVGAKMHREIADLDYVMNYMRDNGTTHLVNIMNDYDILPVHNFRYGHHDEAVKIYNPEFEAYFQAGRPGIPDGCWYGCTMACAKCAERVEIKTGPFKGQMMPVDGPEYETVAGIGSNCGIWDPHAVLEANLYCDAYGIDTISFGTGCAFAMECYEEGVINREITGGLELNFGNADAMLELLHRTARGEGFGKIFGQGVHRMKQIFAEQYGADPQFLQDIGMECKGLEYSEYVTKESLAMQGGYGLANKGPQHDEAWLIFMDQVNNQIPSFEDKAEALHYFPMWRTWFGLNGLCKLPWNDVEPADNKTAYPPQQAAKVPEHVANYVQFFKGVTGREDVNEPADLIYMSEKVYQFQRVFNVRMGKGTREYDDIPYRSVGPVTKTEYLSREERYDKQLREQVGVDPAGLSVEEKMAALRRYREGRYEELKDAVYARRGWTREGIPTVETLKKFDIDYPEVVAVVEKHLVAK